MRNETGDLQLIAFNVPDSGDVTRTGEYLYRGGDVTETALSNLAPRRALTVACRAGDLYVTHWQIFDE